MLDRIAQVVQLQMLTNSGENSEQCFNCESDYMQTFLVYQLFKTVLYIQRLSGASIISKHFQGP
jgi:hypothetical protein